MLDMYIKYRDNKPYAYMYGDKTAAMALQMYGAVVSRYARVCQTIKRKMAIKTIFYGADK